MSAKPAENIRTGTPFSCIRNNPNSLLKQSHEIVEGQKEILPKRAILG